MGTPSLLFIPFRQRELLVVLPVMISDGFGQLQLSVIDDVSLGCGEVALSATARAHSTAILSGED